MSMYKTQAVKRLEAFFETNYQRMYGVALQKVGEHQAWDVVNNTYLSLLEKEERGRGEYKECYGSKYESYVYGALYGMLSGMQKPSREITESALTATNDEGEETSTLYTNLGAYDNVEMYINSLKKEKEICSELVTVCATCNADVEALVRAIKHPENMNSNFIAMFFASLRKAAKKDSNIMSLVEDFIKIYGDRPQEVDKCLVELGVSA